MDKIAVLIPCYNESKTIKKVINDYKEAIPEAVIYVYDNNSSDGTDKIAREAGAVIGYEFSQGKGNVIRRMFREIDAKCYLMVDGDDTYPAENAQEMIEKILYHGADMVVGDRLSSTYFKENKRPFHSFGNILVRKSINVFFNSDISDIMTGYRAFSYNFVKTFPVLSKGFEIGTEMTIHAVDKRMQIENVVTNYRDRPTGSVSKLNTFSDGLKVLKMIIRLFRNYKPEIFFGIIAIFLEGISALLFVPIIIKFWQIHMVPKFPTLIVAGFIALAGIQSFFTGLILWNTIEKDRRDFESKLIESENRYRDLTKTEE